MGPGLFLPEHPFCLSHRKKMVGPCQVGDVGLKICRSGTSNFTVTLTFFPVPWCKPKRSQDEFNSQSQISQGLGTTSCPTVQTTPSIYSRFMLKSITIDWPKVSLTPTHVLRVVKTIIKKFQKSTKQITHFHPPQCHHVGGVVVEHGYPNFGTTDQSDGALWAPANIIGPVIVLPSLVTGSPNHTPQPYRTWTRALPTLGENMDIGALLGVLVQCHGRSHAVPMVFLHKCTIKGGTGTTVRGVL